LALASGKRLCGDQRRYAPAGLVALVAHVAVGKVARAQAALDRSQKALEDPQVNVDPAAALAEMQRAQARLEAAAKR